MNQKSMQLIDLRGRLIAPVFAALEDGLYSGSLDSKKMPADVAALFYEFEEAVNQQLFTHVDKLENKISALGMRARFDNGFESPVTDLQIFPTAGDFSFRLAWTLPIPSAVKDVIDVPIRSGG